MSDTSRPRSRLPIAAALVLGAVAVTIWWLWPKEAEEVASAEPPVRQRTELMNPNRPSAPPVPGRDEPEPIAEPEAPDQLKAVRADAYASAKAAGDDRPGEAAFRAMIDAFMKYNAAFAEAQAAEEGLTITEVHELTYFGFLVLETQRWPEIEALTETQVSAEQREKAEALMHTSNAEFKDEMRRLVDEGASEEERKALIADTQERYLSEYYELTGMNPELLDELLAGDPGREGAPADTPPPPLDEIEPAPAPPPIEPRPEAG